MIGNILLIVAGRALAIIFKEIIKTQVSINKSMNKKVTVWPHSVTLYSSKNWMNKGIHL